MRYVITVQALREAGLPVCLRAVQPAKMTSATAVEQLLGRVLRMPQARQRGREALNRPMPMYARQSFPAPRMHLAIPADPPHGV